MILAFGKTPKELGVPGEAKFKNKGVSYCTICDAPFFKGQDVALVSWGDLAREPVTILSSVANKFYWIYPGRSLFTTTSLLNKPRGWARPSLCPTAR